MVNDIERFTVGLSNLRENLLNYELPGYGISARECVLEQDKVRLYRYTASTGENTTRPAVLVIYALVNRPWILDLKKDRSFIARLLEEGMDVYLLDWGYPEDDESSYGIDKYVCDYMAICVETVSRLSHQEQINMLGVCQGGTLALCYSALFPEQIRSLVCMVTPVDFCTSDNTLGNWVRHVDVDRVVDYYGNVPGSYLDTVFRGLKPLSNGIKKYIRMILASGNDSDDSSKLDDFIAMERWLMDTPDQPGEFFRQFVTWFYQENQLVNNKLELAGKRVLLKHINCPVFNITATQDHLVPLSASSKLGELVDGEQYRECQINTGHIGVFVSSESLTTTPVQIAQWIQEPSTK